MTSPLPAVLAQVVGRLWPYQRSWYGLLESRDDVVILGGRQIGKNWALAVWIAVRLLTAGGEWHVVSANEDNAKQAIRDISTVLRAINAGLAACGAPEVEASVSALRIELASGAYVAAHCATPRALVGKRGSIVLDELSALPESVVAELYEAAYPLVDGQRRLGREARLVVLANAGKSGGAWHKLWRRLVRGGAACTRLRWSEAMAQLGHSATAIARMRGQLIRRIGHGAFAQWYECEWRTAGESYLSGHVATWTDLPPGALEWPQVVGYDIGWTRDLSAVSRLLVAPDGRRYALPTVYLRAMPGAEQRRVVASLAKERQTLTIHVDAGGATDHVNELRRELGSVVVPYHATIQSQWAVVQSLRAGFESGVLRVKATDADLIADLEAIEADTGPRGQPRVSLPRTVNGHCDGAIALALADWIVRGGRRVGPPIEQPSSAPAIGLPSGAWARP